MTPTSGEADGIRLIRSISLIARALTSSGMPAASTFSRSSLISACCGSSSPSSRWIALSCSRRMYSRWVLSISDLTSVWIFPLSSRISIWRARNVGDELEALDDVDRLEQLLALLGGHVRAVGDHVGQEAGLGDVARGDRGLRRDGRAVGDVLLDLGLDGAHERLDLDARRGARRGAPRRGATRYGLVWAKPWTRRRPWPWTMARTVPSWSWTTWAILASVPTA